MSDDRPTVFIVDDDPSVLKCVERLVRLMGYQAVTFQDARSLLEYPGVDAPSCLVLDVNLPGLGGIDLLSELTGRHRSLPVVFITGYGDVPTSVKAMKAGAIDFLTKPFREQELLDAILKAVDKDRDALETRARVFEAQRRLEALTPREREVMSLVVAGKLNKQIARTLGVGEKTIKVHRGRVMAKTGATSVAELVRLFDQIGSQH
jgi:FixJ family two-component response regulator